jgi:hypothetical protein
MSKINNQVIKTIIFPVKDMAQAKTLYSRLLGIKPYLDEAYYVGGGKLFAIVKNVDNNNIGLIQLP